IGRTGRMGKDGIAYLFVCPDQGDPLTAIENLTNKIVTPIRVEGFEVNRAVATQPAARELFNNTGVSREPEPAGGLGLWRGGRTTRRVVRPTIDAGHHGGPRLDESRLDPLLRPAAASE